VEYSNVLEKYGRPAREYFAIDDGCTSIDDQRDCQSNQRYRDASLFIDSKNGISKKRVLLLFQMFK
jgi:hypothetical protein